MNSYNFKGHRSFIFVNSASFPNLFRWLSMRPSCTETIANSDVHGVFSVFSFPTQPHVSTSQFPASLQMTHKLFFMASCEKCSFSPINRPLECGRDFAIINHTALNIFFSWVGIRHFLRVSAQSKGGNRSDVSHKKSPRKLSSTNPIGHTFNVNAS